MAQKTKPTSTLNEEGPWGKKLYIIIHNNPTTAVTPGMKHKDDEVQRMSKMMITIA